jgi:hypothetical protein
LTPLPGTHYAPTPVIRELISHSRLVGQNHDRAFETLEAVHAVRHRLVFDYLGVLKILGAPGMLWVLTY